MSEISGGASLRNVETAVHDSGGGRDKLMFALSSSQAAMRLQHTSTVDKSGPMLSTTVNLPPPPPPLPSSSDQSGAPSNRSDREWIKARRQMKLASAQNRTSEPTEPTTGVHMSPAPEHEPDLNLPRKASTSSQPPPGLSATERMEWKRKQKAK